MIGQLTTYKDKSNEWRWRLVINGQIVAAATEGYKRKTDCLANIDLVLGKQWTTA